jgi:hypothetical protein
LYQPAYGNWLAQCVATRRQAGYEPILKDVFSLLASHHKHSFRITRPILLLTLGVLNSYYLSSVRLFVGFTANGRTEGANENFLISKVFRELAVARSILYGFGWELARNAKLIQVQLVIERNRKKYEILDDLGF